MSTPASDPASLALKTPPHSLEAEQAVLGGLMVDGHAWDAIGDKLHADHFYRPEHRLIFGAAQSLATADQAIDAITVSECLDQSGNLEKLGGISYLAELVESTPSAANISAYADIVRERAVMRELISVGAEIAEVARQPGGRTSQEVLDFVENQVFAIAEKGTRGPGLQPLKTVVANALNQIESRYNNQAELTGIATGFSDLDRMTSGLQPGDLVIVAGRPSMGKTLLGMNVAEHAAIRSGKKVVEFSL